MGLTRPQTWTKRAGCFLVKRTWLLRQLRKLKPAVCMLSLIGHDQSRGLCWTPSLIVKHPTG